MSISPDIAGSAFCYDLSYGTKAVFAKWALQTGAQGAADGLGMLVEQAALSYEIWFGVKPETNEVYRFLSEQLA